MRRLKISIFMTLLLVPTTKSFPAGQGQNKTKIIASNGFFTAILQDSTGKVWAGNEETALFSFQGGKASKVSGPPDAYCYALAEDRAGRIWVGTGLHGVCVYDGRTWQTIGPEQGLAGYHVYSIHASRNEVYVGTESGVSVISKNGEINTTLTRDGLPSNEISDIVEDREGVIWFSGFTGGIARTDSKRTKIHLYPKDELVTEHVNDLHIDDDGMLWISGIGGITVLDPAKLEVVARYVPARSKTPVGNGIHRILPHDDNYVRGVCGWGKDRLAVAFRRKGLHILKTGEKPSLKQFQARGLADFAFSTAPTHGGGVLVGYFGGPLVLLPGDGKQQTPPAAEKRDIPPLPELVPVESRWARHTIFQNAVDKIRKIPVRIGSEKEPINPVRATYLGEDWTTQGNWIGRYGHYTHILCAMNPPFDFFGGDGDAVWAPYIGEHTRNFPVKDRELWPKFGGRGKQEKGRKTGPSDGVRYWLHWPKTDIQKVLQIPTSYGKGRRQSEWDDHAEAYPFTWKGPHLFIDLSVMSRGKKKEGIFVFSMYFMNKDGHKSNNRFRDYLITIKRLGGRPAYVDSKVPGWEKQFDALPPLAEARIHDFRGGVYKQFVLTDGEYTIKVNKNGSFNTIISGLFLDKVQGDGKGLVTMSADIWRSNEGKIRLSKKAKATKPASGRLILEKEQK